MLGSFQHSAWGHAPSDAMSVTLRDSILRSIAQVPCTSAMPPIMQDRPDGSEPDLNGVVDQVQEILLGPMLQSMRSSNPSGPDLAPALGKIMDGFRTLNAAIANPASSGESQSMDS